MQEGEISDAGINHQLKLISVTGLDETGIADLTQHLQ